MSSPNHPPLRLLFWALLGAAVAGCSLEQGIEGELVQNLPPDTEITIGPASREAAGFQVHFYWKGDDSDGEVDHFEWRISNNGPDGILDREDTLGLPWNVTLLNDSTFVVTADLDSFPDDVADPQQDRGTYRYWQTHTLFLRAVDDRGLSDPTPAHSSFTGTTLAPRIDIDKPDPVATSTCLTTSRTLTYGWSVHDPDDPLQDPQAVRYLLIDLAELPDELQEEMNLGPDQCLTAIRYRELDIIARLPEEYWSPWIPFDAPEDSGRTVTFPSNDAHRRLLFAVQAMDRAGAVTPTFDWNVNVRHVRTSANRYPQLHVVDRYIGERFFVGSNSVQTRSIIAEQPVQFSWNADAAAYGGIVEAYRYGWNVADPNDEEDPGWSVAWGLQWDHAPPRSFGSGNNSFVVQVRDNSGSITRATFDLRVVPMPARQEQRSLLLIDDWGWNLNASSLAEQDRWLAQWSSYLDGRVEGFSPKADILKVNREPLRVNFETISRYRAIIWFTNGRGAEPLLRESVFNIGSEPVYNWMSVYLRKLGNMLICGIQPMQGSMRSGAPDYPIFVDPGSEWLYRDWCLEAIDMVRPGQDQVRCEEAIPVRTELCDRLMRAEVPSDFYFSYPSAAGLVSDLQPDTDRLDYNPLYKLRFEEFYNVNPTCESVTLSPRPCQEPMFLYRALRDEIDPRTGEPFLEDPQHSCYPTGWPTSTLDASPAGLVIRSNSATKPIPGSEDFLWGFHPLAFRRIDMEGSLIWILRERWALELLE